MKREHSYTELTKAYASVNQHRNKNFVESIYIDMLINESILKEKRSSLKRKIDMAIDQNDKNTFLGLVEQLLVIEKQLNA